MAKKSKSTGKFAVVVQFPPQISKPTTEADAKKLLKKLSVKIPARTGRKLRVVKV